jgi:hypothetical protein
LKIKIGTKLSNRLDLGSGIWKNLSRIRIKGSEKLQIQIRETGTNTRVSVSHPGSISKFLFSVMTVKPGIHTNCWITNANFQRELDTHDVFIFFVQVVIQIKTFKVAYPIYLVQSGAADPDRWPR